MSRLGEQDAKIFNVENCRICQQQNNNGFDPNQLQQAQKADLQMNADELKKGTIRYKEYKAIPLAEQESAMAEQNTDSANSALAPPSGVGGLYFYHPDHLGTSTALTDYFGNAYQFFLNLPFGETMAQQLGSNYYNSPYKFNGKELDEETGLYYYGARYYSPRESIWLSVDPLAEKHPDMSPYTFCANNPVLYVDPDGRDWGISKVVDAKTGAITYNVTLKIASINSSTSKVDMEKFNASFKSQVETSFSGSYKDGEVNVTINTSVEIRALDKKDSLAKDEHFIDIQNASDLPGVYGEANKIYGKTLNISDKYVPGMMDGSDNNTLPHETGHTGGLFHPDVQNSDAPASILFMPGADGANKNNAMYSGSSGLLNDKTSTEINQGQFKVLIDNISNKKVNQD